MKIKEKNVIAGILNALNCIANASQLANIVKAVVALVAKIILNQK